MSLRFKDKRLTGANYRAKGRDWIWAYGSHVLFGFLCSWEKTVLVLSPKHFHVDISARSGGMGGSVANVRARIGCMFFRSNWA